LILEDDEPKLEWLSEDPNPDVEREDFERPKEPDDDFRLAIMAIGSGNDDCLQLEPLMGVNPIAIIVAV
jgi:hypothetical protein